MSWWEVSSGFGFWCNHNVRVHSCRHSKGASSTLADSVLVCFLHACLCLPAVRGVTNKPVSLVFKLNPHFKACSHTLSLYGSPSDSFKSTPLVFSLSVLWCFVVRLSFLSDQTAPRLCCVSPWSSRGLKIRQLYHICHSDHHHAVMSCSVVQ